MYVPQFPLFFNHYYITITTILLDEGSRTQRGSLPILPTGLAEPVQPLQTRGSLGTRHVPKRGESHREDAVRAGHERARRQLGVQHLPLDAKHGQHAGMGVGGSLFVVSVFKLPMLLFISSRSVFSVLLFITCIYAHYFVTDPAVAHGRGNADARAAEYNVLLWRRHPQKEL